MAYFTVTSTLLIDGATMAVNQQVVDTKSIMDYTKDLSTSYLPIVTNTNQPTGIPAVFLSNTGSETALIRFGDGSANYYFTALTPGCSMSCPQVKGTTLITDVAARGEGGATTLRVIALYI
jgi:hypothetical protein